MFFESFLNWLLLVKKKYGILSKEKGLCLGICGSLGLIFGF